jgi:hypothetical protein
MRTRLNGIAHDMNGQKNKAWFPAKRHGIGWGFQNCWQGWAVLAGWVVLVVAGLGVFRPDIHPLRYVAYDSILTLLLLAIIVAKGERFRWRRGGDSDARPGL